MLKFLLKITVRTRIAWTMLLVVILAITITTYEALAPVTDSLGGRLRAYNEFSSGFIIVVGKGIPSLALNDFRIERFIREHPDLFGPPEKFEETIEYWVNTTSKHLVEWYPFTEEDYEDVLDVPNVESIYRLLNLEADYPIPNVTAEYFSIKLVAIELEAAEVAMLPFGDIERGRFLRPDEDAIVINFRINRDLGFDVGDLMPFEITLKNMSFEIIGVYSNLLPSYFDPGLTVIANIDTIWKILDVPQEERRYNGMLVKVQDTSRGIDVVDKLREIYPDSIVFWQQQRALTSFMIMESLAGAYHVMRLLFLAAAGFIIVAVSLLDLIHRRREIGLLTSTGWRERDIFTLMLTRALVIGLLGAVVGIMLSYVVGGFITKALVPDRVARIFNIFPVIPDPAYLLHAPLLSIILSTAAFTAGYIYYRRQTPLTMLQKI